MVNAAENDRLVWIDCEMTGLDLEVDELVEIAIVVTDFDLNALDPGFQIVIKPDASALANMGEFVTKMHETSGLLDEIPNGVSLAEAESEALEYIQRFVPEGKAPLAGNTIGTDRMFLAKYMPRVDRWLHYRNVDVSSVKELLPPLVPAGVLQRPGERRRPPRPGRHPRIDPRARLLPPGRLRARTGPDERRGAYRRRRGRVIVRPRGVIQSSGCPEAGAWWL